MMKGQATYIAWRFYLILTIITLIVLALLYRVFDLAILDQHFLRQQGDERVLRMVSTPAFRGMIVDRNGFPLAVSTMVYSVWINPREFAAKGEDLSALAHLLSMKPRDITAINIANQKKKRAFVYLRRALSPEVTNQIKALAIPGVYYQQDYRRYYPEGEAAAHVVGFTNVDDKGQEGMELAFNSYLAGEPGKKWVIKDRYGQVISEVQNVQDEKPGHDLVLSIDRRVQYLAYRELLAGVQRNQAKAGSVIVMDTVTGEILAMANVPSYNPNNRPAHLTESIRNRAVTDLFEPGSTIKAFTVATALESGRFKPDTIIETSPGWVNIGHHVVQDEQNNGAITVTQVLALSSNIGAAKMILSLPPDRLWDLLRRVGFGEATGVNYPGEPNGVLTKHNPWGDFTLATLSFGYGLSVTALQLSHAYSVFANYGVKKPISLLKIDQVPEGERVLNEKTAKQMLTLLEAVVTAKHATAPAAQVPGYRVAGKTGTAKKVGVGGYAKHHYTSTFVGIAPMTNPRYLVAVVLHDPQGKYYYGGLVSAPIFERIMEATLRLFDVPPDSPLSPPAD